MDLKLSKQRFIVTGASSGFGRAIAERLLLEGADIIAVARRQQKLNELSNIDSDSTTLVSGDLTQTNTIEAIVSAVGTEPLHGAVFNAGGPPPSSALETQMDDWDNAYQLVMRWKIQLAKKLIPQLKNHQYGRLLFIESGSTKQPIPNLVLSNAFRLGVVGFAKTLAGEVASHGITVNILAPGAHDSPAIDRVVREKAEESGITYEKALLNLKESIPVKRMGNPEELASLAAWLLSNDAGYVTGQTISHAGGKIQGIFG